MAVCLKDVTFFFVNGMYSTLFVGQSIEKAPNTLEGSGVVRTIFEFHADENIQPNISYRRISMTLFMTWDMRG